MKTQIIPLALLVAMAAIMIGSGVEMGAMAATQTFDNAKKIVIKAGADTFVINVNSVKGDKGDTGAVGPAGSPGANSTVAGPAGPQGQPGKDGSNGTSIVVVCSTNSTNPLCGNPTPPTPINGTGNTTSLHHK